MKIKEYKGGHYAAAFGNRTHIIDASVLPKTFDRYLFIILLVFTKNNFYYSKTISKYPLGHMINRPPQKTKPNCCRISKAGLMYIKAMKNLDTKGKWIELYASYNCKKV